MKLALTLGYSGAQMSLEISRRLGWVRPVLDFAHMHATSDGEFLTVEPFAEALAKVDAVLPEGARAA